jgi:hypothetical protein
MITRQSQKYFKNPVEIFNDSQDNSNHIPKRGSSSKMTIYSDNAIITQDINNVESSGN